MLFLKTDFRQSLLILFIITILIGTLLVRVGGFLTDEYFSRVVNELIGAYGEYDLLLTLASDKEELALEQIEKVVENRLAGSRLEPGPRVVGSSNYLLKLPEDLKTGAVFADIDDYFSDIPGLMSETIITEPRLSVRGFRGDSLAEIRPLIEKIPGIAFMYPAGDGLDIIVSSQEQVSPVKSEIKGILGDYQLLEVRYPLGEKNLDSRQTRSGILEVVSDSLEESEVMDVTASQNREQQALLKNLKEMKDFLISYATRVTITGVDQAEGIDSSSHLIIPATEIPGPDPVVLQVIENSGDTLVALIQEGEIAVEGKTDPGAPGVADDGRAAGAQTDTGSGADNPDNGEGPAVYLREQGQPGAYLGQATVSNPRQNLSLALEKLNEITPRLNGFLEQSQQLVGFSNRLEQDLEGINQGLQELETTGQTLNQGLEEWQQQGLSSFLLDLTGILEELKQNAGNIQLVQSELIKASNRLRGAAGQIEEKMMFVPRENELYSQLLEIKNLFMDLSTVLNENYDLVDRRMENMDPLLDSIEDWQQKIDSLLGVEQTLTRGADWQQLNGIMETINRTAGVIETGDLQENLNSLQHLLKEVKTTQLPVVLGQLEYIQSSLPDLQEAEIVETINLIDRYLAGQVIPGEQIQLLIKGGYSKSEVVENLKPVVQNPAASYLHMEAGMLQPNPRGEVFNILKQVRAVISVIIALIFTLLVLILDQSLLISTLRLNGKHGYCFSFISGALIFTLIYWLSRINFPYLNIYINLVIGGGLGLLIGLFSRMLNPVSREEWEAGRALGFSTAEIMREIIIPSGKPGLLYLLNYPRLVFK